MSMSTHVTGFIPPDEKWEKMKKVWIAAVDANIEIPREVEDFFDGQDPRDMPGREVRLGNAVMEYRGDAVEGYEILLDKLPENVKTIRFYNSW